MKYKKFISNTYGLEIFCYDTDFDNRNLNDDMAICKKYVLFEGDRVTYKNFTTANNSLFGILIRYNMINNRINYCLDDNDFTYYDKNGDVK